MQNEPVNIDENSGAPDEKSGAPAVADTVPQPRDPVTGLFTSKRPADPALDAEIEQWATSLPVSYPNASPELRALSKHAYSMFRRLSHSAERGAAVRPSGRVPAAVREAGAWLDRLTRIIESLEATNAKRKAGAQRSDLSSLLEAHKRSQR